MPLPLPISTSTTVGAEVADDQVGDAVAGQVGHHDFVGTGGDGVGHHRLEGAVAVAQEHADRVVVLVGDDDVLVCRRR